ncbi:MAG: hypothetical protein FJ265_20900, partial [Planctomycetes bacterium]|nr:hypothetical protein [Planctomycetota bacterium]
MRWFVPFACVAFLSGPLAGQLAQAPAPPRLLQLGPVPAAATVIELRADGTLARPGGARIELADLDTMLAGATAEFVLAV